METQVIKGDKIQEKIFTEVKSEISELKEKFNQQPGIAFIGFSGIPLGKYNIPLHINLAQNLGFKVTHELMPEDATEEALFSLIDKFNSQPDIHAIVLLQPLPAHLIPIRIVNRIKPEKEVEGFHPLNMMGNLIPEIQLNNYPMCLPTALFEMFKEAELQIQKGQEWVFVLDDEFFTNSLTHMIVRTAASKVVPKDSPLTFINKNSEKLPGHAKRADFLVLVSKFPEYFQAEWVKPGSCIIDIYSNLVKEVPSKNDPGRLVPIIRGGVNVKSVEGIAGAILPIPGGLMTVVMAILFRNALLAFKCSLNKY